MDSIKKKNINPFYQRQNFIRLEQNIDTNIFFKEISESKGLTDTSCVITAPHVCYRHSATHYFLRAPVRTRWSKNFRTHNLLKNSPTTNYNLLPKLRDWLEKFAEDHKSTLGRAYISILKPHSKVLRHYDTGLYPMLLNRLHLVLQTDGSKVEVDGTVATFHPREVWWFNHLKFHEFFNDSDKERIHVIFDLYPKSLRGKLTNVLFWLYSNFNRGFAEYEKRSNYSK